MVRTAVCVMVVALAGCGASASSAVSREAPVSGVDPVLSATAPIYGPRLFGALCNGRESAPSVQEVSLYGVVIEQSCGLLAADLGPRAHAPARRPSAEAAPEADDPVAARFYAGLAARYTEADGARIEVRCAAAPEQCDSFAEIERQYLVTHNDTVFRAWDRDVSERRAALASMEAERRRREGAAQGTLGDALSAHAARR